MLLLYSNFGVFLDFYCMGQLLYTVVPSSFLVFSVWDNSFIPQFPAVPRYFPYWTAPLYRSFQQFSGIFRMGQLLYTVVSSSFPVFSVWKSSFIPQFPVVSRYFPYGIAPLYRSSQQFPGISRTGQLLYTVVSDIFAIFTVFNTSCVPYKNIRHKKNTVQDWQQRKRWIKGHPAHG